MLFLIAAVAPDRGIGYQGTIPWPFIREDMDRFRNLTLGVHVIMGSRTFHSIQRMPLPGRGTHIILSSRSRESVLGQYQKYLELEVVKDFPEEAMDKKEHYAVIGGAGVYERYMGIADRIYLTRVMIDVECDVYFPPISDDFELTERTEVKQDSMTGIRYWFETWERHKWGMDIRENS